MEGSWEEEGPASRRRSSRRVDMALISEEEGSVLAALCTGKRGLRDTELGVKRFHCRRLHFSTGRRRLAPPRNLLPMPEEAVARTIGFPSSSSAEEQGLWFWHAIQESISLLSLLPFPPLYYHFAHAFIIPLLLLLLLLSREIAVASPPP